MNKLLFLLLLFSNHGFAQNEETSPWSKWENTSNADTLRLEGLRNFIIQNYLYQKPLEGAKYSRVYSNYGVQIKDKSEEAKGIQLEGLCYFLAGELDSSYTCLKQSLKIFIEINHQEGILKNLANLALVTEARFDLEEAIEYFLVAKDLAIMRNDSTTLAVTYKNLGGAYLDLRDFKMARNYFQLAYDIAEIRNDSSQMGSNLMNIGLIEIDENEHEKAVKTLQKSLALVQNHPNRQVITRCQMNLGALYTDLHVYDSAKIYLFKALKTNEEIGNFRGVVMTKISLSDYYLQLNRLDSAEFYASPFLLEENRRDYIDATLSAADFMHEIYIAQGKYKEALEVFKLHQALSDSVSNADEKTEIIKIEYQYNLDKQHLKDSLKYQEAQHLQDITYKSQLKNRNIWLISISLGSFFLIVLVLVIIYAYRQKQKANNIISEQNTALNQEKRKTELNFLKNQISPHFFFNSLNTIYALSQTDNKMAGKITHKLGKLMRYLVYDSDQSAAVTLKEEIDFLTYYIELSEIRMPDTVKVDFNIAIQNPDLKVPPLLFVNLVENSFKHGVSNQEKSHLNFTISEVSGKVTFTAKNSIPKNSKQETGGVGTTNLKRRLNLIYGEGNYKFILKSEQTVFTAIISFDTK